MNDEGIQLIVDNEDFYLDAVNVFYIHPQRLHMARCISDNQFLSCTIKYSPIDNLTSMNFSYVLKKLMPEATCEVIIHQPISVMQDYDAKQVEANAKLAGFTDFVTSDVDYVDRRTNKKFKTKCVSFIKPLKKPAVEELEEQLTSTKRNNIKKELKTFGKIK